MSKITDRADADTLARIGRNPGCKRSDTLVVKAAVTRLINAGMVIPPSTTGRLYLTEAGTEAVWQPEPRAAASDWYAGPATVTAPRGPVVLDGRFGNGVTHQCGGVWHLLGQNATGHDIHECDGTTTHRYIGAHRSALHKCGTGLGCELAEVTEEDDHALAGKLAAQMNATEYGPAGSPDTDAAPVACGIRDCDCHRYAGPAS